VKRRRRRRYTVTRRHGKIDHLPAKLQREVNNLLLDPRVRYEDIATFLKTQGYDVSRMCVSRYGRRFMEQVRKMRMAEDQSQVLLAQAGGDELLIEEATSRLFAEKFMALLMEPGFDLKEFSSLVSDFTRLQRASHEREKLKSDLAEKVAKTADPGTKSAKPKGLSERAAAEIRRKILGIDE
jgi:hypothetical protein